MGDLSPAPTGRSSLRRVILVLFPWLGWFGLSPTKALKIKSAVGRTEIEGGGPAAARVGDLVVYLYLQVPLFGAPVLFYATTPPPAANWQPIATGSATLSNLTAGTPVVITAGSAKVQIG